MYAATKNEDDVFLCKKAFLSNQNKKFIFKKKFTKKSKRVFVAIFRGIAILTFHYFLTIISVSFH